MNILIPDSWLREHVKTDATPKQIKDCLSLCGPSVEKILTVGNETVYDIEVTTNRIDMYSVRGIAREASVILPEFGIPAKLKDLDLYNFSTHSKTMSSLGISIVDDASLCKRILAVKLSNISIGPSPRWISKKLELCGQRSLNNVIDITNYVMWEMGHPIHAFDFDRITSKKIVVRLAKKGETLVTLDGKHHTLNGGEIVFDDGQGEIIDLPGIMGTANTVVNKQTKNVLLFIENSDPVRIRQASMGLSIRTQAAVINEKGPDAQCALETLKRAVLLYKDVTKGTVASALTDIYPKPEKLHSVRIAHAQIEQALGNPIDKEKVNRILTQLEFKVSMEKTEDVIVYDVVPPTNRSHDITIPEDIVEEVARIYGYHTIGYLIPGSALVPAPRDKKIMSEEEIKIRLRDWGYTEIYSYSMISKKLMEVCDLPLSKAYSITNPLSDDLVYMRPSLLPSMLRVIEQNLHYKNDLSLFELANVYTMREGNLPNESSELIIAVTGEKFLELKGIASAILHLFGIPMPKTYDTVDKAFITKNVSLTLGQFGYVGLINEKVRAQMVISQPITVCELHLDAIIRNTKIASSYTPVSRYPSAFEDYSFIVPAHFSIGPFLDTLRVLDGLITRIDLVDSYEQSRTIRITYASQQKNLTSEDLKILRSKILDFCLNRYQLHLKSTGNT